MADGIEVPCPFSRPIQFLDVFSGIIRRLSESSIPQIIGCLEGMPHASDLQVMLWDLPETLNNPLVYLRFLDGIHTSNHWLWSALLNTAGGSDLIIDRLLSYIKPLPADSDFSQIELRMVAIDICCDVFLDRTPSDDRFFSMFDILIENLIRIIDSPHPISLQVHSFRWSLKIISAVKFRFGTEQYLDYWSLLIESSANQRALRQIILRFVPLNLFCDYSLAKLGRIILQNCPDHNDIWGIAHAILTSKSKLSEKPLSVLQMTTVLSVTNEVLARTCSKALPLLIRAIDCQIPWMSSFIKKATGFVIIAQSRHLYSYQVGLVIELFSAMSRLQVEWLQADISTQAAILLGSQKVPMAIVNSLKPAIRYEAGDLTQWESQVDVSFDIDGMLASVKDEGTAKIQCTALRAMGTRKKGPKIGTISLPAISPVKAVISPRNRGKGGSRLVIKPTRIARLQSWH
jgi:hypothetical protein